MQANTSTNINLNGVYSIVALKSQMQHERKKCRNENIEIFVPYFTKQKSCTMHWMPIVESSLHMLVVFDKMCKLFFHWLYQFQRARSTLEKKSTRFNCDWFVYSSATTFYVSFAHYKHTSAIHTKKRGSKTFAKSNIESEWQQSHCVNTNIFIFPYFHESQKSTQMVA